MCEFRYMTLCGCFFDYMYTYSYLFTMVDVCKVYLSDNIISNVITLLSYKINGIQCTNNLVVLCTILSYSKSP